jgi:serine phosphatase RsbU (regulator of sigma subunit)
MELTKKKKLSSYLVLRVFIVSFFLMILPLFLHSIFMYRQEFTQKRNDVFNELKLILQSRFAYVNELVDEITYSFSFNFNQFLTYKEVNNIEFFPIKDGKLICDKDKCLGLDIDKLLKNQTYFSLDKTKLKDVLISKIIYKEDKLHGIVLFSLPISFFTKDFFETTILPYHIDTSLVNKNGYVYVSTNKDFIDTKLGSKDSVLKPVDHIIDSYEIKQDTRKYFAVKKDIPNGDFDIFLDVSLADIQALHLSSYLMHIGSLIFFIFIIGGVLAFFLIRRISKPLKALYRVMNDVSLGNMQSRYISDKMGFEINVLGNYFNETMTSLLKHQKEAEKQKMQKLLFQEELKIGREIQQKLFPSKKFSFEGLDIAFGNLSAKEVSGDFYDLFNIDENNLACIIADTSGKGISACLYSLSLRSLLRSSLANEKHLSLAVSKANNLFYEDANDLSMFVTSFIGIYNKDKNTFSYTNAGHLPGILKKQDNIEEITTDGIALGVKIFDEVQCDTLTMKSGDILVLYTDGVIDTENDKNEFFGIQRLRNFVKQNKSSKVQDLAEDLLKELSSFSKDKSQNDDTTFLIIKVL